MHRRLKLRLAAQLSLLLSLLISPFVVANGNQSIESFSTAKRLLLQQVYAAPESRRTLYCQASFDENKQVQLHSGFATSKYLNRLARYETEHVVPAENFGRSFKAWREGHPECVNNKGKPYKGRRCAEKTSAEYRLMQADMYNLYPAIGAVNAARSNYNFSMLNKADSDFGSCDLRIEKRKVQPPEAARGAIARSYLYMEASYPRYSMSSSQRKLMQAWDKQYPVSAAECQRAAIIERVQHNRNPIMSSRCAGRD
ncbi:endonuclease I family protein [Agarivorans sp.]|uniref:endonuclease I family protein n=1 Tax=Agarivorans sp. TaxID=1872412 RepID=UPI003CFC780F